MKIDSIRVSTRTMQRVDPEWRSSSYRASELGGIYFAIEASGETGVGASASHPRRATAAELTSQLEELVAPRLLNHPVDQAWGILAELAPALHSRAAIAVDLAMHDLLGRLAGIPSEVMWGGPVRDRINLVRMVGIKEPDKIVEALRSMYEAGTRAFKLKVGDGIDRDIDRVRRVRQAYGDVTIMVDANGSYDLETAVELTRGLGDLDVHCIEQPLPYKDMAAMAALRARSPVPLMADQMVETAADAVRAAATGAADLVSLKLTKMGSIAECLRVAHICAENGLGVHLGGCAAPGIVDSALTRLAVSTPDIDVYAEAGESLALVDDQVTGVVYRHAWAMSDGRPGLGGVHPDIWN